jgi:hypothetical protein
MSLSTNNTQHSNSLYWVPLCWVSHFIYCYAECRYTVCHYTECHYTECHFSECHYAVLLCWLSLCWVAMLNVIMLNIVVLNRQFQCSNKAHHPNTDCKMFCENHLCSFANCPNTLLHTSLPFLPHTTIHWVLYYISYWLGQILNSLNHL